MSETVKVQISARAKVTYSKNCMVRREIWDRYQAMCEAEERDEAFERAFGHLIGESDLCDPGELEDFEMSLVKKAPAVGILSGEE